MEKDKKNKIIKISIRILILLLIPIIILIVDIFLGKLFSIPSIILVIIFLFLKDKPDKLINYLFPIITLSLLLTPYIFHPSIDIYVIKTKVVDNLTPLSDKEIFNIDLIQGCNMRMLFVTHYDNNKNAPFTPATNSFIEECSDCILYTIEAENSGSLLGKDITIEGKFSKYFINFTNLHPRVEKTEGMGFPGKKGFFLNIDRLDVSEKIIVAAFLTKPSNDLRFECSLENKKENCKFYNYNQELKLVYTNETKEDLSLLGIPGFGIFPLPMISKTLEAFYLSSDKVFVKSEEELISNRENNSCMGRIIAY